MPEGSLFHALLIAYIGLGTAGVLMFLLLIARFYQVKSGQPSHYALFAIALVFFFVGALRYAFLHQRGCVGDMLADGALFLGGLLVIVAGNHVFRLMTGGHS
ncbi:MAG: hypothetical protein ACUVWB_01470 [Anaerolineae bacterium]